MTNPRKHKKTCLNSETEQGGLDKACRKINLNRYRARRICRYDLFHKWKQVAPAA